MSRKGSSKAGLVTVIGLLVITLIITIWLFHYLSSPEMRSQTFSFTLTFICILEALSFGYFTIMFMPHSKKSMVWALYPAIGVLIGVYVAVSVVIVIGYTLLSILVSSPKAYYTTLTIELLVFLIALGSIIILNAYKKVEDTGTEKEGKKLADLRAKMEEAHENFLDCKRLLEVQTCRNLEADITKLRERLQFCAPFGRSSAGVPDIENEIQIHIASLANLIAKIPSTPKEGVEKIAKKVKHLSNTTLRAMKRREKLLIK